MRELSLLREVMRREARRALGSNPYLNRLNVAEARGASLEAAILALPVNVDRLTDLQKPDGSGFYFQVGYSRIGGPDTIA